MKPKELSVLYGERRMVLRFPDDAIVLESASTEPLMDPDRAVLDALDHPVGCVPLRELLTVRRPGSVAVTISDITRPVPNRILLSALLRTLGDCGVSQEQIVILIGTGMHRASTADERRRLVGDEILDRYDVMDHDARDTQALVKVRDDPPVRVNRRFAEADFRIVTGLIEPHFMAGFSGGRKGVCPALVDLETVRRFHGYETLSRPSADAGILVGNPCHDIALDVARTVGVDFLLNVAINRDRRVVGVYAGDLEKAHAVGCEAVARACSVDVSGSYDLVVTNGGGAPLDATFYQAVKGMCMALPALGPDSFLLQVSECDEGLGSGAFANLLYQTGHDWSRFLADIAARPDETRMDQWELQMLCRVLQRIGRRHLFFAGDGLPDDVLQRIAIQPLPGPGDAARRAQRLIDGFVRKHPGARIAVIPEGPYTMLTRPGA
jgi:lactate racemase